MIKPLPADRHAEHSAAVGAGEGEGGEAGPLEGRGPPPPDTVAGGVRHALNQTLQYRRYQMVL